MDHGNGNGRNDPFKLAFIPIDVPSSALLIDVPRGLVAGLEMVNCRAIEAPCMLRHGRLFFIPEYTTFKTS
eukprot:scaffold63367_cov61-Attheya_sp.AAC.8